jgi:hypothetical protein
MKTFQKCMEKICDWKPADTLKVITMLKNKLNDDRYNKLQKMVTAILRINTQILNYNNQSTEHLNSDDIKFEDFVKKVYVESARRIWSQPYLFYEKGLNSIEIKRNHNIAVSLIKESVLSAIRKLLLTKNILDFVIDNSYKIERSTGALPEANKNLVNQTGGGVNGKEEILNIINNNLKVSESDKNIIELNNNVFNSFSPKQSSVSDLKSSSTLKKIVNKSFENKQENDSTISNHNSHHNSRRSSHHSSHRSSAHPGIHNSDHSTRKSSKNTRNSNRYNTATNNISIDTSIKNKLMKDLMTDTMSYNPEDGNDKYQDIFSNSEVPDNTNRKLSKTISKDKEQFYNNYLKK